ncbi:tetratricopeptide repeat protein [Mediterranea massiliensis]|uniref:tetratricopeptide repeat protein n=1 Tax=Mediterranea massiliensis TaxID=1841865 RepID=UPI00320BAD39
MRIVFFILFIVCLFGNTAIAQDIKRPDSYNYIRGIEALQNEKYEEALDYLNKEINDSPKNGYAFSWLALLYNYQTEYGRSLTASDQAVKFIPKKDKEYRSFALLTRADTYRKLGRDEKALDNYNQLLKEQPDCADAYEKRAQLYYEQTKYSLADKDYQKIITIDPGSVMGYMGIGRNANAEKRYDEAIKQFDYVTKLAKDYSSGYSFRAESYIGLRQYNKAIDDIIHALSIDGDDKAFFLMQEVADSAYTILVSKLKVEKLKEPNNNAWSYNLGVVNEYTEKYKKAIPYYKEAMKNEASPIVAYRIATCYAEIGNYDQAIDYCEQAINLDSTDYRYPMMLATLMDNSGQSDKGISLLNDIIISYPDYGFAYYQRGWIKDHSGDIDGAIEDYSMAITLSPDYAYAYMNRGVLWQLKNEKIKAKKDFEKVIELDSIPSQAECSFYAYYYLGQKEKAVEVLDSVLINEDKGNYYDAACLYSVMGEKEKALEYLQRSLELGFRRFAHIKRDRDLNNIRNTNEFKMLIKKYETKPASFEESDDEKTTYINKEIEIPFTKENGMYKVKCSINNLPLYFILDTGASVVSISSVEATFMMKNDYIRPADIIGKQNYLNANGEVSEGTVINLRNVNFGGLDLNDIRASVVHNQSAPLLLGQSVLSRLGNIEIDNVRGVLRITYKEEVK